MVDYTTLVNNSCSDKNADFIQHYYIAYETNDVEYRL